MRIETNEIKIYKFEELSNETKETVFDNFRNQINYSFDFKPIVEGIVEDLELKGFCNPSIRYDLSCCQGSGASFICEYIDYEKLAHFLLSEDILDKSQCRTLNYFTNEGNLSLEVTLGKYSNYHKHQNTVNFDVESNHTGIWANTESDNLTNLVDILEDNLKQVKDDLCSDILKTLHNTETYLRSEEYIIEQINSNEYEFTADGQIY